MSVQINPMMKGQYGLTPRHLRNAVADGEFILESAQTFYAQRDCDDCLTGSRRNFFEGTRCAPLRLGKGARALLICVRVENTDWFSWIHAD